MTIYEYLKRIPEPMPEWIGKFNPEGGAFDGDLFFSSRIVYYPGAGSDGHPVKLFGSTHCAHSFIYVDSAVARQEFETELEHPVRGFNGYHSLARLSLSKNDLIADSWTPTVLPNQPVRRNQPSIEPFAFLEILERDSDLGDDHGAARLAILFLGADGHAAYDALFCHSDRRLQPFALLVQDHGFGGNHSCFGNGGLLERIAISNQVFPEWLVVAEDSRPWAGYEEVPEVQGDPGGRYSTIRQLFRRDSLAPKRKG